MLVAIVDCDDQRRPKLVRLVASTGNSAVPAPTRNALNVGQNLELLPDLLLLHVGESQQDAGDNIKNVLAEFSSALVLCYTGGTAVTAARVRTDPNVALFPGVVPMGQVDGDFERVIHKVVSLWPQREELPPDWFRSAVTGFDPILEAKLEILCSLLRGKEPPSELVNKFKPKYPTAFLNDSLCQQGQPEALASLRKVLFNENFAESKS